MREVDKRRIATFLRRAPWTGHIAQRFIRAWQPWVTVGAVGAVFNDKDRLLIVEHVFHPEFPWGLPGGWMARHESPANTVRRELREETALRVDILKPLVISQTPSMSNHLDIAYLCYAPPDAGEIRLSSELLAYQWADPADLPPIGLFHTRVIEAALAERSGLAMRTEL